MRRLDRLHARLHKLEAEGQRRRKHLDDQTYLYQQINDLRAQIAQLEGRGPQPCGCPALNFLG